MWVEDVLLGDDGDLVLLLLLAGSGRFTAISSLGSLENGGVVLFLLVGDGEWEIGGIRGMVFRSEISLGEVALGENCIAEEDVLSVSEGSDVDRTLESARDGPLGDTGLVAARSPTAGALGIFNLGRGPFG